MRRNNVTSQVVFTANHMTSHC